MNVECWWIDSSPPLFPPNYSCQICNLCVGPIAALTQSSQWLPKSATSLPKLKLTKSDGIWRSSDTTNPTSSQLPLCPSCDMPLQDHQHQCDAAGDQTTEKQLESARDQGPDENLLNLKHVQMLSKTKVFPFLKKNTIFCKKKLSWPSLSLTVWLLGTALCIAYASFLWWITKRFLTTIWKFFFNNGMKSKEKCSFQLECGMK